jgi:copper chaperone NosL
MRITSRAWCVLALVMAAACGAGAPEPAVLDVGREACAFCRMTVSQAEFASQVVVPGELPKFFDDLGCLGNYLAGTPAQASAVIYIADRRTKTWVRADEAVFTRVPTLSTPMGSHLVAHATPASRDADPEVADGVPATLADVVPAAWQAQGARR